MKIKPCPYCGKRQKIEPLKNPYIMDGKTYKPVPHQQCKKCSMKFHVNPDLTLRKLTEKEELAEAKAFIDYMTDQKTKRYTIENWRTK